MEPIKLLQNSSPFFSIDPNSIEILSTPNDFHKKLKVMFAKASRRIIITSLYLGTGRLEKELIESIKNNMKSNQNLKIKFLFDYSRALRNKTNSKTILDPILKNNLNRAELYLFHSPHLRGFFKNILPERVKEVVGVQHIKVYVSDNQLLISGANLSEEYFKKRQDRYIILNDAHELCNFYECLFNSITKFSFKLDENGEFFFNNDNSKIHPYLGDYDEFSKEFSKEIIYTFDKNIINIKISEEKTYIVPLIQCGKLGIHHEEYFINYLLKKASLFSEVYLATAYFNIPQTYIDSIFRSFSTFKIITASQLANGFANASGISKYIPSIYSIFANAFMKLVYSHQQEKRILFYEYEKNNWTFHGKGIWFFPKKNGDFQVSYQPTLTIIGSSNFGYRSIYRDLEFQLVIISNDRKLKNKLIDEKNKIYQNGKPIEYKMRNFPKWLKFVSRISKKIF